MERYYERIMDTFEEQELALESILYEIDLLTSFGPATEARVDGGRQEQSSTLAENGDGKTTAPAIRNMQQAQQKSQSMVDNSNARQESENDARQTNNPADSKKRQQLLELAKRVSEEVAKFINEHLSELRGVISELLASGQQNLNELKSVINEKKPNLDMMFKDFDYDDAFIDKFADAVNSAIAEYRERIADLHATMTQYINIMQNGTDEERDELLYKIRNFFKSDDNQSSSNPNTPQSATTILAIKLGVENPESMNMARMRDYIYNKYKGLSEGHTEPNTFKLGDNIGALDKARNFLSHCKDELRKLNSVVDSLKNVGTEFKQICDDVKSLEIVDDKIAPAFQGAITKISKDLNEFVSSDKFLMKIIQERSTSSNLFVRKAYGVPVPDVEVVDNDRQNKKFNKNEAVDAEYTNVK